MTARTPKARKARRMWAAGSQVFAKKQDALEEALHLRIFHKGDPEANAIRVILLPCSPDDVESMVERAVKVLKSREAMLHTMITDRYEIAARAVVAALIGLPKRR